MTQEGCPRGVSLLLSSLHKALRWALESFLFRLYTVWMRLFTGFWAHLVCFKIERKIAFCSLFVLLGWDLWQTFLRVLFACKCRVGGIILSFLTDWMRLLASFFGSFFRLLSCLNHLLFLCSIAPSHRPNKGAERIGNAACKWSVKWRFWGNKVRDVPYQYW